MMHQIISSVNLDDLLTFISNLRPRAGTGDLHAIHINSEKLSGFFVVGFFIVVICLLVIVSRIFIYFFAFWLSVFPLFADQTAIVHDVRKRRRRWGKLPFNNHCNIDVLL